MMEGETELRGSSTRTGHSRKIKNFHLHMSNEENRTARPGLFLAGEMLSGVITFDVVKPTTVVRVRAVCEGYLRLGDRKKRVLDFNQVLVGQEKGRKSQNKMAAGKYWYPFSVRLPEDLPTTIFRNDSFKITYRCIAMLLKKKPNDDLMISEPFTVHSASQVVYDQVLHEQVPKTLACNKNGVTCTATMPKTGFYLGENLTICADIENTTSSSKRVKVGVKVQRLVEASGTTNLGLVKLGNKLKHNTHVTDRWSKFIKVAKKMTESFEVEVPLNTGVPTTKHELLDIEYIAHVSFVTEGIVSDSDPVTVPFSITIAPHGRAGHVEQIAQDHSTPQHVIAIPSEVEGAGGQEVIATAPPLDRLPSYDDIISGKHPISC